MRRILIIQGHPDPASPHFGHALADAYADGATAAGHVVERLALPCTVVPVTSEEFPTPARRPKNSRLSQKKFIALSGAPLRPWREAVDEYLAAIADCGLRIAD